MLGIKLCRLLSHPVLLCSAEELNLEQRSPSGAAPPAQRLQLQCCLQPSSVPVAAVTQLVCKLWWGLGSPDSSNQPLLILLITFISAVLFMFLVDRNYR